MKFGLFDHLDRSHLSDSQNYKNRIKIVQAAEEARFSGYHLAEHHMTPLGLAPSPSVFLSAVAQHTKKIRLGPLVYLFPMYHPLRLIEEICMLDQLSDGRLELGVGAGVSPFELGYFGVGENKNALYHEALDVVTRGLTNERLTHNGAEWKFDNVPMILKTLQDPMPPLWAGVGSEAGMVFCARHGMHAIGLGPTMRIKQITDFYTQAWNDHADDPARAFSPTSSPNIGALRQIYVAASDEKATAEAEPAYRHWYDSLQWLWREHGVTAPANLADNLSKGIANGAVIAGSPETVREAIRAERDATGYNYLVLQFAFGTLSVEQITQSLDMFASEVMPAFAD